ncbi:hypothetical protein Dvina_15535 [Dactylosporangium vinaceum]|uniref:SH3b domain-containing protein n=1 Tax=Dactylosporangium vinaceum TaxID=53362 RepID=A0ABV5M249_9ACTN|nr:hypothetical protein [Dactylosporangium vinaceum]UAB99362.1 hypothetical protein Dvina_15535 [Dactylosporangium vinaceum]
MYQRIGRITARAIAAGAAVLAIAIPAAPSFAGIGGYSVAGTGGAGLQVRTSPYDAAAGAVAVLGDGTPFVAECAVRGRNISGNTVWHQISSPAAGWISDYYTNTPGFNQYLPGEPECGGAPPTGTREDRALAWARSVIGNSTTNGDLGDSNHGWDGWCDNFVGHAYGRAASGYYTAIDHYWALYNRGLMHGTSGTAPAGALVFFAAAPINGNAGHVMLSEGNGNYITSAPTVRRVPLSWPGATYLGWSYADPEWAGR